MSSTALFMGYGGSPLIMVDAADFDGLNDYMMRGADLSGIADGKSGIVSFWYRDDGSDGNTRYIMAKNDLHFTIRHFVDNHIDIVLTNAAGSNVLLLRSTSIILTSANWLHLLVSWDLATSSAHLYINDVSDLTTTTLTNDVGDYAGGANWSLGSSTSATNKVDGCLAEFYFTPNQYLDLSDVNNRRKFISATGKPVYLGSDGSLPIGAAPAVYLHLDNGEAVANFAVNRGTGGNFSITGTLDTATTSPSD